jgi:hypothetical protein
MQVKTCSVGEEICLDVGNDSKMLSNYSKSPSKKASV